MSDPMELSIGDNDALKNRLSEELPPVRALPAQPVDAEVAEDEVEFDRPVAQPAEDTESTPDITSTATIRTATTVIRRPLEDEDEFTTTTESTDLVETSSEEPISTSISETASSTRRTSRVSSSTEESTTSSTRSTTTSRESSTTTTEEPITTTTPEHTPPKETAMPESSKLPAKGDTKDDGLGTGTTIGIVIAAAAGIGVLLVIISFLLKWRQKRNFRKRTAHLADHKDIFGYQNDNNDVQSSNSKEASRDPEPSLNTIPVTPPYRPEVRQAQKRNSWIDERGLPAGVTYADFTVPRQQSDYDPGAVDPGLQPQYGAVRRNMPLPGGMFDQQHPGGAFDPMRMHSGYEQPFDSMRMNRGYQQDFGLVRQDSFSARATTAAPPPRNRHFPPGQGTAYAHENPYPYMPTGPR